MTLDDLRVAMLELLDRMNEDLGGEELDEGDERPLRSDC